MSNDQHGRWLLAQLLNWHRREHKSFWWRYFHLLTLTDEELREETDALGELTFDRSWPDPAPGTRSDHLPIPLPAAGARRQARQRSPRPGDRDISRDNRTP